MESSRIAHSNLCFAFDALTSLGLGLIMSMPTKEKVRQAVRLYRVGKTTYPSLRLLAEAAGISYSAAVKRVQRGWSDAEVFYGRRRLPKELVQHSTRTFGKVVTIGGKKYRSVQHAYEVVKPRASLAAVRARITQLGWTPEQAFELESRLDGRTNERSQERWVIGGQRFATLRQAYDLYRPEASFNSVRARLRYGWSLGEALGVVQRVDRRSVPKRQSSNRSTRQYTEAIVVDEVEYESIAKLARAYDMPPALVYSRVRGGGWSYERAVTESASEEVVVRGTRFRSALQAWETIGKTSYSQYEARRIRRHPLEVCLGLDPLPKKTKYKVDGKAFGSLSEVARAFGLTTGKLRYRLNHMGIQEAVQYVPANGRYSKAGFDRDPVLAATIGSLYFVRIRSSDGPLYKVGITARGVARRFGRMRYDEILELQGPLGRLYEFEQQVVREFSDHHYRGDDEFDGRTELFLLLDSEAEDLKRYLLARAGQFGAFKRK